MTNPSDGTYECEICGSETEVYRYPDRETAVGICTDCWFGFLTGNERKAIAERWHNDAE